MPSWAPRPGRRGPQAGQPNSHPGADIRVSPNPFCRQLPRYWSAWRKARGRNTSQPGCPLGRLGSCWIQVKRKLGRSHQTGLACSTAGTNLRRQLMGPCHGWPIGTIADGSLIVKALILRTSTHWLPLANAQAAADCITASPPQNSINAEQANSAKSTTWASHRCQILVVSYGPSLRLGRLHREHQQDHQPNRRQAPSDHHQWRSPADRYHPQADDRRWGSAPHWLAIGRLRSQRRWVDQWVTSASVQTGRQAKEAQHQAEARAKIANPAPIGSHHDPSPPADQQAGVLVGPD